MSCDCLAWKDVDFGVWITSTGEQLCKGGPNCVARFNLVGNQCADPGIQEHAPWCYVARECTNSLQGAYGNRWKRC